jgi:hypothetical protein
MIESPRRAGASSAQPRERSSRHLVLALTAAMLAVPVRAGAPFQTDDPVVVARDRSELLVSYRQTLAQDGRRGVLPSLELHHGALANLELDLVVPIAFHTPPGEQTRHGYGDTELGLKYGLVQETDATPLIGFAPKLDLPTGNSDRGLGNGGAALFLPIWMQKTYGDFGAYGGGGYGINRGADNRNYWFVGGVVGYRIADRWLVGVELFHTTPQTIAQRSSTGFNAGGAFQLTPHLQWLFSAGRAVRNRETNRVSSYLGCQLSF